MHILGRLTLFLSHTRKSCLQLLSVSVRIWIDLGYLQLTGETVGEVKAVADMHQRKAEMARNSDAFIALPGWYIPASSSISYQLSWTLYEYTSFT